MSAYAVSFHPLFQQEIEDWASSASTESAQDARTEAIYAFCRSFESDPLRMQFYSDASPFEIRIAIYYPASPPQCLGASVDRVNAIVVFQASSGNRDVAGKSALERT